MQRATSADEWTAAPGGANRTGLPDRLKSGIEALSGVSMDDVRVRYNSAEPSRLGALAYARGREIHVAPGQEAHLPHEAWHLTQQAQGRVRPTEMTAGLPINADPRLEREADQMSARALSGPVARHGTVQRAIGLSPDAPAQLMSPWWEAMLHGAGVAGGLAAMGAGALLGAPLVATAGAAVAGGSMLSAWQRRNAPVAGPVTDGHWYDDRHRTAYGYTNSSGKRGLQGPHFVPHVAKKLMAKRSVERNPNFDPRNIPQRTGVLPSAGQARRMLRQYEEKTGDKIPLARKKALDRAYRKALKQRQTALTAPGSIAATTKAMELNPLTTYAHGRVASPAEIGGKGERASTVAPDLDKMEQMKKGGPSPNFAKLDYGPPGFKAKHLDKFLRDTGKISRGDPDLSELDTDSDDDYV